MLLHRATLWSVSIQTHQNTVIFVMATMQAGRTCSNLQISGSRVGDWLLPAYVWETERADTVTVIYRQWTANGTNHPIKVIFREIFICSSHAHKLVSAFASLSSIYCNYCVCLSVSQLLILYTEFLQRHSEYKEHPNCKQKQVFDLRLSPWNRCYRRTCVNLRYHL